MEHEILYRPYSKGFIQLSETEVCDVDDLEYHTSWDWLMSVIHKCFDVSDDGDMVDIMHHLQVADMKPTYQAVVEFINQYNTEQLHEWARINLLPQENAETRLRFAEGIENYDEDYIKEHRGKQCFRKNK